MGAIVLEKSIEIVFCCNDSCLAETMGAMVLEKLIEQTLTPGLT